MNGIDENAAPPARLYVYAVYAETAAFYAVLTRTGGGGGKMTRLPGRGA
ncbi:MAG: hypothetical protein LBK73_05425 [Treponema sp.]|jgi:hypothetical protein|nr:hypothetical protein [Treponema sp.]